VPHICAPFADVGFHVPPAATRCLSALYQGTSSLVPKSRKKEVGFSPCARSATRASESTVEAPAFRPGNNAIPLRGLQARLLALFEETVRPGAPHLRAVLRCGIPRAALPPRALPAKRYRCLSALYQGTSSLVPKSRKKEVGFSPCARANPR
jgi:hypothetical protein